jgi:predicted DCC family thiol-disulfide oxidoreductase YuxK
MRQPGAVIEPSLVQINSEPGETSNSAGPAEPVKVRSPMTTRSKPVSVSNDAAVKVANLINSMVHSALLV